MSATFNTFTVTSRSAYVAFGRRVEEALRLEAVVDSDLAQLDAESVDLAPHLANLLVLLRAQVPPLVRLCRRFLLEEN